MIAGPGRWAVVTIVLIGLAACSQEPRSASYFEAHLAEAAQVADACKRGAHRGQECVNAQAGVAAAARSKRMDAYRKGFSKD